MIWWEEIGPVPGRKILLKGKEADNQSSKIQSRLMGIFKGCLLHKGRGQPKAGIANGRARGYKNYKLNHCTLQNWFNITIMGKKEPAEEEQKEEFHDGYSSVTKKRKRQFVKEVVRD